ncbi:hypothetical protein [Thalassobaculum sp.]|jgi:hypothetical protein|uniref:hypothetical protein n=1 Tax=Thalassobaculum sp. TaxID=2022740 RepID=UPI003B5BB765
MAQHREEQTELKTFSEEQSSLWLIALGPTIWALHFVICYAATAVVCAKLETVAQDGSLLRAVIGGTTVVALAAIGWIAWRSWRQWDFLDDRDYVHHKPVTEHRHEFLGHASFLLACLSLVGVLYVSLPALFVEGCV